MDENPDAPDNPPAAPARRILDLVALLAVLSAATVIFVVAGPEAFAAVTTGGVGLFTTWRGRR
jgi:hypothetical protein